MADLTGQVAIVTGAASGIGAQRFVRDGAAVLDRERSETFASMLSGRVIAVPADVSKEDDVRDLFDKTVSAFGRPT